MNKASTFYLKVLFRCWGVGSEMLALLFCFKGQRVGTLAKPRQKLWLLDCQLPERGPTRVEWQPSSVAAHASKSRLALPWASTFHSGTYGTKKYQNIRIWAQLVTWNLGTHSRAQIYICMRLWPFYSTVVKMF